MTLLRKLLLSVVSTAMTVLALLLAVYVGGPAVRTIVGVPQGFREDFVSHAAFRQALLVQATVVGSAFFAFGIASRRLWRTPRYSDAIWIANSLAVGVG